MTYSVRVNVSFDRESLCEHDFAPVEFQFGLERLSGFLVCRKCSKTDYTPTTIGDIDRARSPWWRSSRDD